MDILNENEDESQEFLDWLYGRPSDALEPTDSLLQPLDEDGYPIESE